MTTMRHTCLVRLTQRMWTTTYCRQKQIWEVSKLTWSPYSPAGLYSTFTFPAHGQKCINNSCHFSAKQYREPSTILPHLACYHHCDKQMTTILQLLNHCGHTYMHIHTTHLHTSKHNLRLESHAATPAIATGMLMCLTCFLWAWWLVYPKQSQIPGFIDIALK